MSCNHYRQMHVDRRGTLHSLPCATRGCSAGHDSPCLVFAEPTDFRSLSFSPGDVSAAVRSERTELRRHWDARHGEAWMYLGRSGTQFAPEDFRVVLERQRRELEETIGVLQDVLDAKGESWLSQLVSKREALLRHLEHAEHVGYDYVCGDCAARNRRHLQDCEVAELLRIVGGADEVQRQVNVSHDEAAQLDTARTEQQLRAGTMTDAQLDDLSRGFHDAGCHSRNSATPPGYYCTCVGRVVTR